MSYHALSTRFVDVYPGPRGKITKMGVVAKRSEYRDTDIVGKARIRDLAVEYRESGILCIML